MALLVQCTDLIDVQISRLTVQYFIRREDDLPDELALTYGADCPDAAVLHTFGDLFKQIYCVHLIPFLCYSLRKDKSAGPRCT